MCQTETNAPAGNQSITTPQFDQDPLQVGGQKKDLGQATKRVSTKFGTFMRYALPALQGGLYGLGSRQPSNALGSGGFGAGFGGGFVREQGRQQQLGMMRYQLAMEQMDRQLRMATLQNTIENQRATQDWHRGNLEARLRSIEDANDRENWVTTQVDDPSDPGGTRKLVMQTNSRNGQMRPAMMPGVEPATSAGIAPMTPGGNGGGATPALPNVQGSVPPGMFGNSLGIGSGGSSTPAGPTTKGTLAAGANSKPRLPAAQPANAMPGVVTSSGVLTKTGKSKHDRGEVKMDEGIPTGIYGDGDKLYRVSDPKIPDDLKAQLQDTMNAHKQSVQEKKDIAASGRTAMQGAKPTTQYDTQLGIVRTVPAGEAEANPARYHVASYTNVIDSKQKIATIRELDANIKRTNDAADAIKGPGLTSNVIAAGLADPSSDLGKQFQGSMIKSLTPKQRDIINYVRNLRQGVASYKNILSTGGVTDARLNLLEQEMPGIAEIASGDPAIFRQKLKAWTDIYQGVRNSYKDFFENMLGEKIDQPSGGGGSTPKLSRPKPGVVVEQ